MSVIDGTSSCSFNFFIRHESISIALSKVLIDSSNFLSLNKSQAFLK